MGAVKPNDSPPQPGTTPATSPAAPCDPDRWVDEHGDYLYSYAMLRLRDPAEAQDAVQETFLAALKGGRTFAGKSSERGWLLGILKHKIHDVHRRASRETSFTDVGFYQGEEETHFLGKGLHKGTWILEFGPKEWSPEPGESLDREEFWKVFRLCLSKLPRAVCQVFLMREMDDAESRDICAALEITENNLGVMLHRARMALRRCLERHWFTRCEPDVP